MYVTGGFPKSGIFIFITNDHNAVMMHFPQTGNESNLSQDYSDLSDGISFFTES